MTPRRAAKVDLNQKKIVKELREIGFSVAVTSTAHHGFPDLVCAMGGITMLIEVKSPGGGLTPDQVRFHSEWCDTIVIAERTEDVVEDYNRRVRLTKRNRRKK